MALPPALPSSPVVSGLCRLNIVTWLISAYTSCLCLSKQAGMIVELFLGHSTDVLRVEQNHSSD